MPVQRKGRIKSTPSVVSRTGERLKPRRKNGLSAMQSKKGKILFLCSIPVIAYVTLFGHVF